MNSSHLRSRLSKSTWNIYDFKKAKAKLCQDKLLMDINMLEDRTD